MNKKIKNYSILSNYAWHVPGVGGMLAMLAWLLAGALLGNLISTPFILLMGSGASEYATLISYPVMFIPAMIAAMYISNRNRTFETGYAIDSNHVAPNGWILTVAGCMLATIAGSFVMDSTSYILPPMPEWLERTLESMTQGNFLANFLAVSIMAPFFEEWLCRGTILRGLLNYERINGKGERVRGLKPWLAIVISAAFFALIHLNPWQAIPAFGLGVLFGYVYYRTGSLKLTMLMHFTNNTFALILSNIPAVRDAESFLDLIPVPAYAAIMVAAAAVVALFVVRLNKTEIARPQGNCDEIPAE